MNPAYAFGEHQNQFLSTQEFAEVLARPDHLADARVEDVQERQRAHPALDDGTNQARRVGTQADVHNRHRGIEGEQASVIPRQNRAPLLGDLLVPRTLDPEVVAVE